jgi:hypothetical protein
METFRRFGKSFDDVCTHEEIGKLKLFYSKCVEDKSTKDCNCLSHGICERPTIKSQGGSKENFQGCEQRRKNGHDKKTSEKVWKQMG